MSLGPGELLTVRAALTLLPISKSLLYRLIDEGTIPAVRVRAAGGGRGRLLIRRDDLAAFVAGARQEATHAPTVPDADAILARIRGEQRDA